MENMDEHLIASKILAANFGATAFIRNEAKCFLIEWAREVQNIKEPAIKIKTLDMKSFNKDDHGINK